MKLSTSRLKQIIREEIAALSEAGDWAAASSRHGAGGSALRNPYGSSASAAAEKITGAEGQELEPESRVSLPAKGNGTIVKFYTRTEGRFKGKMVAVVKWDNNPNSPADVAPGILHPETR